MTAQLSPNRSSRPTRAIILALVALFVVAAPGSAQASASITKSEARSISARLAEAPTPAGIASVRTNSNPKATAASSCSSLKRKAGRSKRGSAKRKRYLRKYRQCLARRPVAPAPAPAPVPAPAPTPQAVYLPSIFPNPNGYTVGKGCLKSWEQTFLAAGYSCQYAGYNSYMNYQGSPVWAPVYVLYGVWYCADKQFRFRC